MKSKGGLINFVMYCIAVLGGGHEDSAQFELLQDSPTASATFREWMDSHAYLPGSQTTFINRHIKPNKCSLTQSQTEVTWRDWYGNYDGSTLVCSEVYYKADMVELSKSPNNFFSFKARGES